MRQRDEKAAPDRLSSGAIEKRLTGGPGWRIAVYETAGSTNTLLRDLAVAGAPEGTVAVAGAQTGGRGRLGRGFFSPEGTGLYLSLLLRPDLPPEKLTLVTPAAAVAVCRAIHGLWGLEAGIKWVNDVYLDGRKVCGILTESVLSPAGVPAVIVGIGVNVYRPEGGFPPDIANRAGFILDQREPEGRSRLAAALLSTFWEIYEKLSAGDFVAEYIRRSVVVGREVTVLSGGCERPALALGIDEGCRLLVRYEDGREEALFAGEISIRL